MCIKIRHFPIPTYIQIHACNIAKAAIIIRLIGKKFEVMKPSIWMICHGSNSRQLHIFVVTTIVNNRTEDKMLTDLRNSKGSRELSAVWMENPISGVNQECFESCIFTLYVTVLGQGTRYSNDNISLLPQLTLLAEATITHGLAIPLLHAAFWQSVTSHILFSITSGFVASYYNQHWTFTCRVAS